VRYVLNHPNITCVIPGFRNERQVAFNLGAVDRQPSNADIDFIDQTLK
jgi:aryl-alcohol dehydrogenase-like predicted oxidoreductase